MARERGRENILAIGMKGNKSPPLLRQVRMGAEALAPYCRVKRSKTGRLAGKRLVVWPLTARWRGERVAVWGVDRAVEG